MKLRLIKLLFLSLLFFSSYAEEASKRITLESKNQKIKGTIEYLAKKNNYKVTMDDDTRRLSLFINDKIIHDVLHATISFSNYSYEIVGNEYKLSSYNEDFNKLKNINLDYFDKYYDANNKISLSLEEIDLIEVIKILFRKIKDISFYIHHKIAYLKVDVNCIDIPLIDLLKDILTKSKVDIYESNNIIGILPKQNKQYKLAEELLNILNIQKTLNQMVEQVKIMQIQEFKKMEIPENARHIAVEYQNKIIDVIFKELSFSKLKNEYIKLYASVFTEDELNNIISFYKTDSGKKFIEKQPTLIQQSMKIGQSKMENIYPIVMDLEKTMRDEIEKLNK